jgi:hypothetical protein
MSKSHKSHRLSTPSSIGSSENRISTLSSARTPDEDENNASFDYDAEFENSIEIPHVDERKLKALVTTLLISKKIQVELRRIPDKMRHNLSIGLTNQVSLNFSLAMRMSVTKLLFMNLGFRNKDEVKAVLHHTVVNTFNICPDRSFEYWAKIKDIKKPKGLDSIGRFWKQFRRDRIEMLRNWEAIFILPSYLVTGSTLTNKLYPLSLLNRENSRTNFVSPFSCSLTFNALESQCSYFNFDERDKLHKGLFEDYVNQIEAVLAEINAEVTNVNMALHQNHDLFTLGSTESITTILASYKEIMQSFADYCCDDDISVKSSLLKTYRAHVNQINDIIQSHDINILLAGFRDINHNHNIKIFNDYSDMTYEKFGIYIPSKAFLGQFSFKVIGVFYMVSYVWISLKYALSINSLLLSMLFRLRINLCIIDFHLTNMHMILSISN